MIISLTGWRKYVIIYAIPLAVLIAIASSPWFMRKLYPVHYRDLVLKYAAENNIDPILLAAVIRTESHFCPSARSRRGALGLMQIMPETGRWVACELGMRDFNDNMLYDPETNIRIGSWYLASLAKEFGGDVTVVLAAYNAGRGNVRGWLEGNRWTGRLEHLDSVPFPETRTYVRRVLHVYKWYRRLYGESWLKTAYFPDSIQFK
ncbi:MAG TPA: lytic transglycosylase domain-containing protein [Firmicutes bacterium]|nr:lytic transglycosylase domain-containing protein [Bacillota bacterium]